MRTYPSLNFRQWLYLNDGNTLRPCSYTDEWRCRKSEARVLLHDGNSFQFVVVPRERLFAHAPKAVGQ